VVSGPMLKLHRFMSPARSNLISMVATYCPRQALEPLDQIINASFICCVPPFEDIQRSGRKEVGEGKTAGLRWMLRDWMET